MYRYTRIISEAIFFQPPFNMLTFMPFAAVSKLTVVRHLLLLIFMRTY